MTVLLTALAIDGFRVFFAVVVVVAITTIAAVIVAHTADVDSLADPTPRLGEPDSTDSTAEPGSALQRAQTVHFPDRSGWN